MMKAVLLLSCAGTALAARGGGGVVAAVASKSAHHGSIELISGDLCSAEKTLDNIKGKWSQALKVLGNEATVTAEYDRKDKRDFLKQASVSGAIDKIKYELTTRFNGPLDVSLETTTDDGTKIEADAEIERLATRLTRIAGTRSVSIRDQECELKLSHELETSESKLRLSTVLGSGLKAVGLLSSKAGGPNGGGLVSSLSYELEYDTVLTEGRSLSAKVSPADGTGNVEYTDSATLDATVTAAFPFGGAPSVTAKRAFKF